MQYEELEQLLDSLGVAVRNESPQTGYWRDVWGLVSAIRGGFRDTYFPRIEMKRAAIARLDELIEAAKHRSEEEKRRRDTQQREWQGRIDRSSRARRRVEQQIAGARPVADLERMIASVILLPLTALEMMLRSVLGLEQLDQVHEDLKSCSTSMKQAWTLFSESKDGLLPGDKNELYGQLKAAQERLNSAWGRWKRAKDEVHRERRQAWTERQREREEKHRDFVARVEANIEKLEAKIEKAQHALQRQCDHLSDLRDKYNDAWNADFRSRCAEWIEEAKDRIGSIEESIEQWRTWLSEEHDKLRR